VESTTLRHRHHSQKEAIRADHHNTRGIQTLSKGIIHYLSLQMYLL
jgi:hypothetical protein